MILMDYWLRQENFLNLSQAMWIVTTWIPSFSNINPKWLWQSYGGKNYLTHMGPQQTGKGQSKKEIHTYPYPCAICLLFLWSSFPFFLFFLSLVLVSTRTRAKKCHSPRELVSNAGKYQYCRPYSYTKKQSNTHDT